MKREEWLKFVEKIKEEVEKERQIVSEKEAVPKLKEALEIALRETLPREKFGILFSSGVDSGLIAWYSKINDYEFCCYTIGTENSKDLLFAKKIAKKYKLPLKTSTINEEKLLKCLKSLKRILKNLDTVKAGVGAATFLTLEMVKKDNLKFAISGLGSEEIFAGYKRHEIANNVQETCWQGLQAMYERDLQRDFPIAKYFKIKLLTPFLHKKVIKTAMQISAELKIKGDIKKYILRKTSLRFSLPEEIAFRKKIAAQYGSGIDKLLEKLAKKEKLSKAEFLKNI